MTPAGCWIHIDDRAPSEAPVITYRQQLRLLVWVPKFPHQRAGGLWITLDGFIADEQPEWWLDVVPPPAVVPPIAIQPA